MGDLMDRINAQVYGMMPHAGAANGTLTPGMGGLSANMAPGVIAPLQQDGSTSGAYSTGRTGLVILGLGVLALVAFNVSTRAYQA